MGGPLVGLKIADLSRYISGPYCGMMLADMGAEVIKVEKSSGEDTRNIPPFFNNTEGDSHYTAAFNRNKRAITLNFREKGAKEVLRKLFEWADVIIENFRPGTLEKMGFPPETIHEINPRVIIARCSAFGQTGPYSHRPGFDAVAQAMGGIMSITGREEDPPLLAGTYIIDYVTGMHATIGILSALNHRRITGKGQVVDVSLYESAVSMLVSMIPTYDQTKTIPERVGNGDRYAAPANAFETKNGWVYVLASNQSLWENLCKLMKREDLLVNDQFKSVSDRIKNKDEINIIVQEWTLNYERDELIALLDHYGIPCAPIQEISDILQDEHLKQRKQIVPVPHPKLGDVAMSGVTIKLSDSPGEIRYGIPLIGQHNDEIYLKELGFNLKEYEEMKSKGII